ncbi:MAG: hypothetical protein IT406_03500 [Candidatus Yanofskybacteria bacterium]|nr:hypothetical protein [Candidatus Yanofskybacteria bacterium]
MNILGRTITVCAVMFFVSVPAFAATGSLDVRVVPFSPTPTPSSTPTPTASPLSGGSVSGDVSWSRIAAIELNGVAFPRATVHLLKDGVDVARSDADDEGRFRIALSGLAGGSYLFGLTAVANDGTRTDPYSFVAIPILGSTTHISNILLPPLVVAEDSQAAGGTGAWLRGWTAPGAQIEVTVDDGVWQGIAFVHNDGSYRAEVIPNDQRSGEHVLRVRAIVGRMGSPSSREIRFVVGEALPSVCGTGVDTADINDDGRVDLVDFSILSFWYEKPIDAGARADLNCDGSVTLADVSILAFFWTG